MIVWLLIEVDADDGTVRDVDAFRSRDEAVDAAVEAAKDNGYIDEEAEVTEDDVREPLQRNLCYTDGGIVVNLVTVTLPEK